MLRVSSGSLLRIFSSKIFISIPSIKADTHPKPYAKNVFP